MASSEIDLKVLGNSAASVNYDDPFLSAMLYKVLGLSVMLSGRLLRARNQQRLEGVPEASSTSNQSQSQSHLHHHIIWLSREGLLILEEFILPMVGRYVELKVLMHKLRASFYHIFVLFHNVPGVQRPHPSGALADSSSHNIQQRQQPLRSSIKEQQTTAGPASRPGTSGRVQPPKPTSDKSFLLPALDYAPTAFACFKNAALLSDRLLPGSHPVRLSVKLEYAAFLHDCLHDVGASRYVAKQAVADVYRAQDGMDDESFEDAAEIVRILGKMIKRGQRSDDGGDEQGEI